MYTCLIYSDVAVCGLRRNGTNHKSREVVLRDFQATRHINDNNFTAVFTHFYSEHDSKHAAVRPTRITDLIECSFYGYHCELPEVNDCYFVGQRSVSVVISSSQNILWIYRGLGGLAYMP